jgi:hypothetical protein
MTTISYAGNTLDPRRARRARSFLLAALAMGTLPAAIGVGILLLYWATYAAWLVNAGLIMLPVGSGLVLLGLAFLVTWAIMERRIARQEGRPYNHKRLWLTGVLLLFNFVVAIGCVVSGDLLVTRAVVDVINETGDPIDACIVEFNPMRKITAGPIAAGARVRRVINQPIDASIKVDLTQGANHQVINAVEYASGPPGPHVRVRVKPGLKGDIERLK